MQSFKILVIGKLDVKITGDLKNMLHISVPQNASYSYCPQTSTVHINENTSNPSPLNLHYPAHFQLQALCIQHARVALEGITALSLDISLLGPNAQIILRGNTLDQLSLHSNARNLIDMTQQGLPKQFSHSLARDTTIRMPNQGPPTCIVCCENEVTQLFVSCGHWCLCNACSTLTHCPICRTETSQMRVYQQSTVHHA